MNACGPPINVVPLSSQLALQCADARVDRRVGCPEVGQRRAVGAHADGVQRHEPVRLQIRRHVDEVERAVDERVVLQRAEGEDAAVLGQAGGADVAVTSYREREPGKAEIARGRRAHELLPKRYPPGRGE